MSDHSHTTIALDRYLTTPSGKLATWQGENARADDDPRDTNPFTANQPLRRGAWFAGWDRQDRAYRGVKADEFYPETPEGEPPVSNTLYETNDGKFVTRLATNSKNEAVVEERGTGAVFAIDPDKLKKVVPYTISIRWSGGNTNHYKAKKDSVQAGDVILSAGDNPTYGRVQAVDTQYESVQGKALEENGWVKVNATPLA